MEICVLTFEGSRTAERALKEVSDAEADRNPWLNEVGVVARPLVGRVRITATFPDGKSSTFHEGDLADAVESLGAYTGYLVSSWAGPLASMSATLRGDTEGQAMGSDAEERVLHLDEIKKALPRDSSALALVADEKLCDKMVELFSSREPKVIRRDVADELSRRLEAAHHNLEQRILGAAGGAQGTH